MITLSEKYRIIEDANNTVLQFFEIRTRKKKDGTDEQYEFVDDFFYPDLKSALISFIQKEIKYSANIDEVLSRISAIEKTINHLQSINQK